MSTECAICLNAIPLDKEAFLNNCFHRFHLQCIQRWTKSQLNHAVNSGQTPLTCPCCRRSYVALLHDCVDKSFRYTVVDPRSAAHEGQTPALGAQLQLTAAQRRRRSMYFQSAPTDQEPAEHPKFSSATSASASEDPAAACDASQSMYEPVVLVDERAAASGHVPVVAGGHQGGGKVLRKGPVLKPRALKDPIVETWVIRELQALMLEEDVSLVKAAVLGLLQDYAHKGWPTATAVTSKGPSTTAKKAVLRVTSVTTAKSINRLQRPVAPDNAALPDTSSTHAGGLPSVTPYGRIDVDVVGACKSASWLDPLADVMQPFLHEQAQQFAVELHDFLQSGLSLAAYDDLVFGRDHVHNQSNDHSPGTAAANSEHARVNASASSTSASDSEHGGSGKTGQYHDEEVSKDVMRCKRRRRDSDDGIQDLADYGADTVDLYDGWEGY